MAMHNFGQNSQETNKKTNLIPNSWPNSFASLQQQIQQQLNNTTSISNSSSSSSSSTAGILQSHQYGSYNTQTPTSTHSNNKVDQNLGTSSSTTTTSYEPLSAHLPKSSTNSNKYIMPSPPASSSNMIQFTSANNTTTTQPTTRQQNFDTTSSLSLSLNTGSNMPAPSSFTSFYAPSASTADTLNNNFITNNSGGNNNVSTKLSAHSNSHSALTAAAALQSLNQSHLQRSQQLAQLQQQSNRPPSNPMTTPPSYASNNMPKLGVTSTTSSDHQNHNHLTLQQATDSLEFSARLQQQQQQQQKLTPGIRPPINWQDQLNPQNAGPRWPYASPYSTNFPSSFSPNSKGLLSTGIVNNLSNSNSMIGQDGDNLINNLSSRNNNKNDRQSAALNHLNLANHNVEAKIFNSSNQLRQNYQTAANNDFKSSLSTIENAKARPQRNQSDETERNLEKLNLFTFNLLNNCIPGTNKPKKVVHVDSVEGLRQSIYMGEFYTRFEDIAAGVLNNQVTVPEFSIIDYIRRDKFSRQEMDKMENVHKSLDVSTFLCLMELAHQKPYLSMMKSVDSKSTHQESTSNLNIGAGIYQQGSQQMQILKNSQFLQPPQNKQDTNFTCLDKSRRSSQSPSDNISRSQMSTAPSSRSLPHPLPHQPYPSIPSSVPNSHLHPPIIGQHNHLQAHQGSPLQPTNGSNTLIGTRPPRASSTASFGSSFDTVSASSLPRQPPAAHQSSSVKSTLMGTDLSMVNSHASIVRTSPPVSAHMSSKTPQTPRILLPDTMAQHTTRLSADFASSGRNSIRGSTPINNYNHLQELKSEIDSSTGLPFHTLMSLKQQESMNRELAMKRVGTPHLVGNSSPGFSGLQNNIESSQHNIMINDLQQHSRSPSNSQFQSLYGNHPSMFRSSPVSNFGSMASSNMPPPQINYQKNLSQQELAKLNDIKASGIPSSITSDAQLKQYSALVNAYQQQQQLMMSNKSNPNFNLNNSQPLSLGTITSNGFINIQPQMSSPHNTNDANISESQNQPQCSIPDDGRLNNLAQQPSPKQNNQRSIITGSVFNGPRRNKKAKGSPTHTHTGDPNLVASNTTTLSPNRILNETENLYSQRATPINDMENMLKGPPGNCLSNDLNVAVGFPPKQETAYCYNNETFKVNYAQVNNSMPSQSAPAHKVASQENNQCATEAKLKIITDAGQSNNHDSAVSKTEETVSILSQDATNLNEDKSSIEVNIKTDDIIATNSSENLGSSEPLTVTSQAPSIPCRSDNPEPSKYQKLYTKKAWLQDYDREDQCRIKFEASTNINNKETAEVEAEKTNPSKDVKMESKTVEGHKTPRAIKTETKKRSKEMSAKKNNASTNARSNRTNRTPDNDSEDTNASTSELESDEANSSNSLNEKGLRRMPKRKVKPDKDKQAQSKSPKEVPRVTKRGKKDKLTDESSTNKRKGSADEESSVKKTKRARIVAKLSPDKTSDEKVFRKRVQKAENTSSKTSKRYSKAKEQLDSKSSGSPSDNDTLYSSADSDDGSLPSDGAKGPQKKKKNDISSIAQFDETNEDDKVEILKQNGEKFLQTDPCYDIVPKAIRCLECRRIRQSSLKSDRQATKQFPKANWDDFCRFYEFRKLRYNKASQIVVAGFSDLDDAKESDKTLWLPDFNVKPRNLNIDVAKFIISNVGNEFCNMVMQERTARELYARRYGDKRITWKRAVNGLRELCDVCATTLFNCHYVCERCGFVVCIDCYKCRDNGTTANGSSKEISVSIKKEGITDKSNMSLKASSEPTENKQGESHEQPSATVSKKNKRDSFNWVYCAKNEEHSLDKLILTQIIAGDCLEEVWNLLHEVRKDFKLGPCSCQEIMEVKSGSSLDVKLEAVSMEENNKCTNVDVDTTSEGSHSTLKGLLLADRNGLSNLEMVENNMNIEDGKKDPHEVNSRSTIESFDNDSELFNEDDDSQEDDKLSQQVSAAIEGCISSLPGGDCESFDRHSDSGLLTSQESLTRIENVSIKGGNQTDLEARHFYLCDGNLLVLPQARHPKNLELFRKQWLLGRPVLVKEVDSLMKIDMWLPQYFAKTFGDYRSDLVDCRNGDIHRHSMKKYWEGFEPSGVTNNSKKKQKDENNHLQVSQANNEECSNGPSYYSGSALWRLKDWPPGQDFGEVLPEHYLDFMNNLPLDMYTTRGGKLNLACRLPKEMLKPDLGPKMYSAYGTLKFPERGTTNLHLDISDAINVMIYVSGANAFYEDSEEHVELFHKTIDESFVDQKMKHQIKENKYVPGALWHIFKPSDVQKMRDFLNKVADERHISPDKRTDPIHDQTWYLDQVLLDRLEKECGVKSLAVLQCMGDAILIPAGAPHQVKNLHNCIKVANDFVSPENVRFCLKLTDEFRALPETHMNQEDKLQIKNILYHSVKESLQYIKQYESNKTDFNN